jgi:hypothetical protein
MKSKITMLTGSVQVRATSLLPKWHHVTISSEGELHCTFTWWKGRMEIAKRNLADFLPSLLQGTDPFTKTGLS